MNLSEKHRPATLDDFLGNEGAIKRLRALPEWGGRSYFISGPAGVGKTSLSWIIANACCPPYAIEEMDAADLSMDRLREMERSSRWSRPIGGQNHGFIINEAHSLSAMVVRRLLTTCDPKNTPFSVWIFTTTEKGQLRLFGENIDAHPFLSRCVKLPLATAGLELEFCAAAKRIAQLEGLDGAPLAQYLSLVKSEHCNLRAVLQRIECGEMLTL